MFGDNYVQLYDDFCPTVEHLGYHFPFVHGILEGDLIR